MLRSKIYLELLKYKKNQELKELEDINRSIDKFKDSNKKKQAKQMYSKAKIALEEGFKNSQILEQKTQDLNNL